MRDLVRINFMKSNAKVIRRLGMALVLAVGAIYSSALAQSVPDWENPRVFGINKEPAHATLVPYPDERAALRGPDAETPFVRSLNGPWKFHWAPDPSKRPADWE